MFWKIVSVILASTVKTLFAPPIGFSAGLTFVETFLATAAGGIIGFFIFYYFFDSMMSIFYRKKKKSFTARRIRTARNIVVFKRKYPVWLFVLILPVTSIPVMAVIIRKFFHHNIGIFALSLVAVVIFAFVGCLIFSPIQNVV